jgi:adenylate cyclase
LFSSPYASFSIGTPMITMSAPLPVTSRVVEVHELGNTMTVAQRSIWSFARFVPKDIVKGIIDGSISTELGGVRREVTILFTDVTNFTGIAERADPDTLMRQTSRHFAALTEAFLLPRAGPSTSSSATR